MIGVDTSVLYLMRGGKPMKKIIAIILVITMLACNSVNAASFVQDKKVELNNEHMRTTIIHLLNGNLMKRAVFLVLAVVKN